MSEQSYSITVSDDAMEAWLCFATETPLPLAHLHDALAQAGVVYGVNDFLLQDLAEAHQPGYRYRIAQGTPPEEGLEYCFTPQPDRAPRRLADGRVDFYNLNTMQNVVRQQILVAQIPPDARQPGRTVTGTEIPPTKQVLPLPRAGSNVALSADGRTLTALINGYPVLSDNSLHVESSYTLQGDVDLTVGNLTCIGDVVIAGDVKYDLSVRCARDVTVHGVVDGGHIEAAGAVYLYGNLLGQQKSQIRSAGSVSGLYVDGATIDSQQDIILRRGVRRSHLRAGKSVLVQGNASAIVGGTVQAGVRIVSHDIGSEREMPTRLEILPGIFDVALQERFIAHLETLLTEDQRQLAQAEALAVGSHAIRTFQTLLQQCRQALPQFVAYLQMRHGILPPLPVYTGTIVATGTVYPGVTICIGNASLVLTGPMRHVMFYYAAGSIQSTALDIVDLTEIGAA
jgi:uncharacterized protein (DUF342 family)